MLVFACVKEIDEVELKKCFKKGDYEVLVIGYQTRGAEFGGTTTIEEFSWKFHGPVVLVGPEAPDMFYINGASKEYS